VLLTAVIAAAATRALGALGRAVGHGRGPESAGDAPATSSELGPEAAPESPAESPAVVFAADAPDPTLAPAAPHGSGTP
jgi:hypothetical protein